MKYYRVISSLSCDLNRRLFAPGLPAYADYSIQLEEFLFTQAMIPFFRVNLQYGYANTTARYNGVNSFKVTVDCDLAQAGMDITEIEINPYYIIDRKLIRNKTIPLMAKYAAINSYNGSSVYNYYDWIKYERQKNGVFYYEFLETDDVQPFLNNKEAYILILISFKQGAKLLPTPRKNKHDKLQDKMWLVYRYKVTIEEVSGQGNTTFPMLKYYDQKIYIDKVRIQTENEAFKIED